MARRVSEQDFVKRLEEASPTTEYVGGYRNVTDKVDVRCRECGHEWQASPRNLLHGTGCPMCSRKAAAATHTITEGEFRRRLLEEYGGYELVSEWRGYDGHVTIRCPNGHTRTLKASTMATKRTRECPECRKERRMLAGKPKEVTRDELERDIASGMGITAMAMAHGRSLQYIKDRLDAHGIALPARHDGIPDDGDELRRLYIDEELPINEIAVRIGCSLPTLYKRIKKHGIPMRRWGYDAIRAADDETEAPRAEIDAYDEPEPASGHHALGSPCAPGGLVALKLELSLTPWVVLTDESEVLLSTDGKTTDVVPVTSVAMGDWCLEEICPATPHAAIITKDELDALGITDAPWGEALHITPDVACALVAMSMPCYATLGKQEAGLLGTVPFAKPAGIRAWRCAYDAAIRGLFAMGLTVASVDTAFSNSKEFSLIRLEGDEAGRIVDAMRARDAAPIMDMLAGMPSPIPETTLFAMVSLLGSMTHKPSSGGRHVDILKLLLSNIRPSRRRTLRQMLMGFGGAPAERRSRQRVVIDVNDTTVCEALAAMPMDILPPVAGMMLVGALAEPSRTRSCNICDADDKRYLPHRVSEVREGDAPDAELRSIDASNADMLRGVGVDIRPASGAVVIGVDVTTLPKSTGDHRDRKTIEREQHLMGTFVPKRDAGTQSLYHIRQEREQATGDDAPRHEHALFAPDCLMATPTGMAFAKDLRPGDMLIDGRGMATRVTGVAEVDVDEDFVDLTVHHLGHALVSHDSRLLIVPQRDLPRQERLLAMEDGDRRNMHIRTAAPCHVDEAEWRSAVDVDKFDWVPVPDGRRAWEPQEPPTFSLTDYVPWGQVAAGGHPRYRMLNEHTIVWNCYKSFKSSIYDGIRLKDVVNGTGLPLDAIKDMPLGYGKPDDIAKVILYLSGIGMDFEEWKQRVRTPVPRLLPTKLPLTCDLAYLLGFYIADGTASNGTVLYSLDIAKPHEIDAIRRAMANVMPGLPEGHLAMFKSGSGMRGCGLSFSCPPLASLFKELIPWTVYEKQVPEWLMRMPDDITLALMRGLIDGDGSVANQRLGYTSVSKVLTGQVRSLFARFGTPGRCYVSHTRNALGTECEAMIFDAPLTPSACDLFGLTASTRPRTTLAEPEDGMLVAAAQATERYRQRGKAIMLSTEDGSPDAAVATAAGIVRLRNAT